MFRSVWLLPVVLILVGLIPAPLTASDGDEAESEYSDLPEDVAGAVDSAAASLAADSVAALLPPREIPFPRPFAVGEKLRFSLQWGPIKAGVAMLAVEAIEMVDGRECYRFASTAKSLPLFSAFYKVDDRIESYADFVTLVTRRSTRRIREGSYRLDQQVEWDQEVQELHYSDGSTLDLIPGARDVLGAMYYVRTVPLEVGSSIPIEAHDGKKSYSLNIHVLREETIDTPVGRFDCWVVEPKLMTSGLFRRTGSLTVWLTRDERRLPVLMKSQIKVGAVAAILTGIEPGDPATTLGLPESNTN